jgi:predicted metallo-beta-lactamase superfamily hydrolase
MFHKTVGKKAAHFEFADRRIFKFGATTLRFSEPVYHGHEGSELGWVLMVTIEHKGEKLLFAPDIQGPMYKKPLKKIMTEKPQLAIVGGPPLYLAEYRVSLDLIESALKNLETMVEHVPVIILDHHVLRDENWRKKLQSVFNKASILGNKVVTAAEYISKKNILFEAHRKKIYMKEPPNREFIEWTKIPLHERRCVPPPNLP